MSRPVSFAILIAVLAVTLAVPAVAQGQRPGPPAPETPPDDSVAWPSGDELRRELQDIGFTFRVERERGEWLGWAPRASIVEAPAVTLGGAGSEDAGVRLRFELLQTDLFGTDVDAALTALMEIGSRLPLAPARTDQLRRFVVDDLLVTAPLALEPCYAGITEEGSVLIVVEQETGTATIELASSPGRLDIDAEFELDDCAPIASPSDGPAPGEPTSERITIVAAGEPAMFDPIETVVEGSLVTLVLTFRNETSDDQSLTFETATTSGTDLVAPGEVRLIVVRRLPPGEYAIFSETDPQAIRGVIRIVEPGTE
ncbi:MAG: hypothetical protein AB1Z67_11215 [Candidatus Limnocylindrales bacterium]